MTSSHDKTVIFVLGAPRTGTSAVASVLAGLGIDFGRQQNFVDPSVHTHNPKGFFELVWVNELNDKIFSRLGLSWRSFDFFSTDLGSNSDLDEYKTRISEGVEREWDGNSNLIGIKDPRISLLFPLWESAFLKMGYRIKCVVTLRHPLGYLTSDKRLNPQWSDDRFLFDWFRHVLSALFFSKGYDSIVVDYDTCVSCPVATLTRLAGWVGILEADMSAAQRSLDTTLYHHRVAEAEPTNPLIRRIYSDLRSSSGDRSSVDPVINFYAQFLQLWPLVKRRHLDEVTEKDQAIQALKSETSQQLQVIDKAWEKLVEREEKARSLEVQLEQKLLQVKELATKLAVRDHELKVAGTQLATKQETLDTLSVHMKEMGQTLEKTVNELGSRSRAVSALTAQLRDKEAHLDRITSSLGWRLLSIYGRRIKYPYLLPLYRLYGRLKYARLLPLYRWLGLLDSPANLGTSTLPAAEVRELGQETLIHPSVVSVSHVQPTPALGPHRATVDVIVCVHNALADVKTCLESVLSHTTQPYSLILIDDGSDLETRKYMVEFAGMNNVALVRNDTARGYTFAANQGLRLARGDYVVLLNSDTEVTPDWLDRMVACAESGPQIGIVGPLSNAATWQSIPEIIEDGEFAQNELPQGRTPGDVARVVAQFSARLYPRIPFLNGFCLMIRRTLIEEIGYFDEANFGRGYGEENDYCLRARKAGWDLAVADDVYIYHSQSRSYSPERRRELWRHAGKALAAKHDQQIIDDGVAVCRYDRVLEGIRARSRVLEAREHLVEQGRALWEGKSVMIILPVAEVGGGSNVVLHEAEAMVKMGVDVKLVNLLRHREGFENGYPDNSLPVIYVDDERDIPELLSSSDAAIATWCASVEWMEAATSSNSMVTRAYYIQDFEPFFFREGSPEFSVAWQSYTRYPDLIRITKTEWNRSIVKEKIGVDCLVIGPSVDIDLYRPRMRDNYGWPQGPLRVVAMIRPSSPRRAPRETMEILRELSRKHGGRIEVIVFGCSSNDLTSLGVSGEVCRNAGILCRTQTATLLNEADIFVDFSSFQAMGLTAMEAMCCGAAVIAPQRGGSSSFIKDGRTGLVVDTDSRKSCFSALERLILDEGLRRQIQRHAIADICDFFPERASFNILTAMFRERHFGKKGVPAIQM